jgi:hypothetical protein
MTPSPRYIDVTEVAKIIRAELKAAFPGIKFGVKSSRFSMGTSIDISWFDGPTEKQVEAIIGQFRGGDFDGMQDLYTYRNTTYKGELVHFGAKYISCNRRYSAAFLAPLAAEIARYWGFETPEIHVSETYGASFNGSDYDKMIGNYTLGQYIMQEVRQKSAIGETEEAKEEITSAIEAAAAETSDEIEVSHEGDWTWITFATKPDEATREILKAQLGARWSKKRDAWYITNRVETAAIFEALGIIGESAASEEPTAEVVGVALASEPAMPTSEEITIETVEVDTRDELATSLVVRTMTGAMGENKHAYRVAFELRDGDETRYDYRYHTDTDNESALRAMRAWLASEYQGRATITRFVRLVPLCLPTPPALPQPARQQSKVIDFQAALTRRQRAGALA